MVVSIPSGPSSFGSSFGITGAICFERRSVRVTFSEKPIASNPEDVIDALNRSNWTFEVIDPSPNVDDPIVAYYSPVVAKIERVNEDPYSVDVQVEDDFSFGVEYRVIASINIRSQSLGSWGLSGGVSAEFYAHDPYCRTKTLPRVYDWFGTAVKRFDFTRDAERFSALLQDILEQVMFLSEFTGDLFDPERTPEEFLDCRLEGLGNPFSLITSEMSVSEKRLVALQLVSIYKEKGTMSGVLDAIVRICGIDQNYISVDVQNLKQWGLSKSGGRLSTGFKLGHRRFESSYAPPPAPHPQRPLNDNFSFNEGTIGTARLGPTAPRYYSGLNSPDHPERKRQDRLARLGQWNLVHPTFDPYPEKPDDPIINEPTVETGRKEIYQYRISVNLTLTAKELLCIATIALYMQPAEMHFQGIVTPEGDYTPNQLGISRLSRDFNLHKP